MSESSALDGVRTALSGIAFALLGLQVTLVGLFDGGSFLVVVTGLALSLGGALRTMGSSGPR
ncbi:uncharacterized protein HHUB_1522 [Halobacterium hubeiense]|jgi:hypothetical protein|uniref:Uncharacterized protein n=1 Tax=Halobacterium hubeiense TaxID=1407499 RepID=A0A0U5GY52_9EURY|nr:hypothetical protein [Halobacterium hubeiense]CQH49431.1 uncharacterized protein HHUB_1522 [Halobacterium hubeiense]